VLYGICMYLVFHSQARAAMAAALVSSALQCAALRKYGAVVKAALVILVVFAAAAIVQPEAVSNTLSSLKTSLVYKGAAEGGVLASRESTWQAAIKSIQTHLWFGIGLGTTQNSTDPRGQLAAFASNSNVTAENGSSYLSFLAGVGILGAIPFSCLLLILLGKILRTISWLRKTGNACHPAVPLAMIMVAGLIHAGFEDWLIAPGYYLCVFYWSLAFVFVDVAPASVRWAAFPRPFRTPQRGFGNVAPSR
jgi:O-antigen ligase